MAETTKKNLEKRSVFKISSRAQHYSHFAKPLGHVFADTGSRVLLLFVKPFFLPRLFDEALIKINLN